jgi:hypothetical protein
MASIRRGYSDDFVIKNNKVGIGASNPQEALDVVGGALQGQDLKVTGVSTQTGFSGFLRADHQIAENIEFSNINVSSLSGEIIVGTGVTVTIARVGLGTTMVGVGTLTTENTIDTTDITTAGGSQIDALKVYNTFTPPNGGTNERPYAPKPGELYYNYDFKTIEFFDGYGWRQVDNTTRSGRAVTGAGYDAPGYTYTIDYVNIATRGNSAYFGDLSNPTASQNYNYAACSSSIRGLFGGGANAPGSAVTDVISYITIASAGNCIDFGNLTDARTFCRGFSSSTRALFGGGYDPSNSNIVDYVEIGTLGNALDFGNLSVVGTQKMACSSPTRGLFAGSGPTYIAAIDSFQIASTGNAQDFGDLTQGRAAGGGCSNATRGVFMGGEMSTPSTVRVDTIDFVSISSFGNAIDFGNLSSSRAYSGATSNSVRGLALGGIPMTNSIEYISISTAGNAEDFGDLVVSRYGVQSLSDSHGGLGGF